jgi:hypothetical protein
MRRPNRELRAAPSVLSRDERTFAGCLMQAAVSDRFCSDERQENRVA